MFELTVERVFCAAHAIRMAGVLEPLHGHNWKVTACITGGALNGDGLLCDFHAVELALDEVLAPFHNQNLNATPPFDQINPTAERVAEYLGRTLAQRLASRFPSGVAVRWLSVTEAPGCVAKYVFPAGRSGD
jgi:6-pyruvoyltetrahydropterin/6-carboxytetrahydropterin synthase